MIIGNICLRGGGRLPLYIDYTELKLGGDAVLEKMHSAWHDDPIVLRRPCGDGEEFQLEVRWQAHRYPDEEYLHIMDEFVED